MKLAQPGILAEETRYARYLSFAIDSEPEVADVLKVLADSIDPENVVVGLGKSLLKTLGRDIPGMRTFAATCSNSIEIPSTPKALWCWLRGSDRGEIFHRSRRLEEILSPAFVLKEVTDSFQYDANRDLSGYEDGTENPAGDDAVAAAIVQGYGDGLDGSSFVATQLWVHDFDVLDGMTEAERDDVIGRHISDNEEFDEAPESAHVKRSAQESFDPEAFILRRSMPWAGGMQGGLVFVAFGKNLDAFEAILNRMLGREDGITDALFTFTRPVNASYFWCPPIKDGKLDLSAVL